MKRLSLMLFLLFLLPGCATYKYEKGQPPYEKGYIVSREGRVMPEFTIGQNNSAPQDQEIAKMRFSRRKTTVEQYYEKMGLMKSRLQETVLEPPVMIAKFISGIFRLPSIAHSNYKYEHDPKYRDEVDKIEDEKFEAERRRLKTLKEELNAYVQKDIEAEQPVSRLAEAIPLKQEPVKEAETGEAKQEPIQEEWLAKEAETPEQALEAPEQQQKKEEAPSGKEKAKIKEKKPKVKEIKRPVISGEPAAVILARPKKGFSPLRVHFFGTNSRSPNGRIISYEWDFGDGDKSNNPNPVNTYYSSSFDPRVFTATLTVTDSKGGSASSSIEIEALNK